MDKKPIQRSETQKYLDTEKQLFALGKKYNMPREKIEIEQSRLFSEYLQTSTKRDYGYDIFSNDIWLTKKELYKKHTRYTQKISKTDTQNSKSNEKNVIGNAK